MKSKGFRIYLCTVVIVLLFCACSSPGPASYPIGYLWEDEGGKVMVEEFSLAQSYALEDGSVVEAEDGMILLAIALDTELNKGYSVSVDSVLGQRGCAVPAYYPICEPVVLEEGKTVLLYTLPEEEASNADFELYFLELTLQGIKTFSQSFFLSESK